jgi:anti-sigma factor RsiW
MNIENLLKVQALVDGQLDASERSAVEKLLETDSEARQWAEHLRTFTIAVRNHEPAAVCPETREFYWSQIHRRIQAADARERRVVESGGWPQVLRWLTPALGLAAVAVLVHVRSGGSAAVEANSIVYSSDADQVTIHWVN